VRIVSAKIKAANQPTAKITAPTIKQPIMAISEEANLPSEDFSASRFAVYALAAPSPKALRKPSAI